LILIHPVNSLSSAWVLVADLLTRFPFLGPRTRKSGPAPVAKLATQGLLASPDAAAPLTKKIMVIAYQPHARLRAW
jgi:hypothetical protein